MGLDLIKYGHFQYAIRHLKILRECMDDLQIVKRMNVNASSTKIQYLCSKNDKHKKWDQIQNYNMMAIYMFTDFL